MEDKLIIFKLIEGMLDMSYEHQILERLQISNLNFEANLEYLQLGLIRVQPTKRLSKDLKEKQVLDQIQIL